MATELSFGQWVKQRRKALDMTQHELAQRIGCAPSTIQKIEIEARQPSQQMAELLADHLDLAPDEHPAFLQIARQPANIRSLIFPPVPTSRHPINNLPSPLTSLIGREWEVTTLCARLLQPDVRLLTITGPPGIGKTRLGLQVAAQTQEHFVDGVCFVTLAQINDVRFVIAAIARALAVKDTGSQPLLEQVKMYLHARQLLLILDNFEHLLSAASLVVELLEATPHLKVLITSRATLQVYGEHEFVVPPLALPDLNRLPAPDQVQQYAAVELFVQRARAVQQEFTLAATDAQAVAEICVRLEGLPLAIELAAARSKVLPPPALLTRLCDALTKPLDLLTGARHLPARHRTLRNAIAWSYDLLNPTEQKVFRCLGVFAGGGTLEAVAAVVSGQCSVTNAQLSLNPDHWLLNTLLSFSNHSLVIQAQATQDGAARFSLLEMNREYALEQLEQHGENAAVRRTHATYFLQVAESYKRANQAGTRREAAVWSQTEREVDNLRAALHWTTAHDPELEVRLTEAMTHFWSIRRYLSEGRQWLEHFLARFKSAPPQFQQQHSTDYAQLHGMLAFFTWSQGDYALAQTRLEESVALWRRLQNWEGVGWDLNFLALTFFFRGDFAAASIAATESVTILRAQGQPGSLANALHSLGSITSAQGDYATARALHEECLAIFRQLDNPWGVCLGLLGLSEVYFDQGDDGRARVGLEQAIQHYREADETWFAARALLALGKVCWRQGDKAQATMLWNEGIVLARDVGAKRFLAEASFMLGLAAQERQDYPRAYACFQQSLALYQAMENKVGIAYTLSGLARLIEPPSKQAQLLGATATILDTGRLPMDQLERAHYEQIVTNVRAQLDEATFAAAWAHGQTIPLDEAHHLYCSNASASASSQVKNALTSA